MASAVATVATLVPEDDGSAEATMREKSALRYNAGRPWTAANADEATTATRPAVRRRPRSRTSITPAHARPSKSSAGDGTWARAN